MASLALLLARKIQLKDRKDSDGTKEKKRARRRDREPAVGREKGNKRAGAGTTPHTIQQQGFINCLLSVWHYTGHWGHEEE